jgi:hypothetical protein
LFARLERHAADEGEVVDRLGKLRAEREEIEGEVAVIVGVGIVEPGLRIDEGSNPKRFMRPPVPRKPRLYSPPNPM